MPELPEVETVVRGLAPRVVGRRITNVEIRWPALASAGVEETLRGLRGQRITGIRRHGKYIVFELARRGRPSCLTAHLRMTGAFLVNGEPGPYTRGILFLDGGLTLVYQDIRKFGRWEYSPQLPARLLELGPDPLEVSEEEFVRRLRSRQAMVKALLLDQEFLRGLGNIYADEALFRARLHPRASSARIGPQRARRLYQAIRDVLSEAIAQGGTTIINYVDSDGVQGYFQLSTAVYGKAGQPCPRCGRPVRRTLVANRGTHYCAFCQRR